MTARKSLDIDPELQAILAKIEKKKRDHQMMLGELVLETGVHKELDGDELRAVLIEARDNAIARRGRARTRRRRPTARFRRRRRPRPTDMRTLSPHARVLLTCWRSLRRLERQVERMRKARALNGHRDRVEDRKARTRLLIERGGLLGMAEIAELMEDDRATMLGSFFMIRDMLRGASDERPADLKARWRRRGLRAFDEAAAAKAANESAQKEASTRGEE